MFKRCTAISMAFLLSSALTAAVATAATAQTDTVQVKTCSGTSIALKTVEKRMLDLHNSRRAARGLPRLCINPKLENAARAHSKDMIQRDYFSHDTLGGGNFAQRIESFGYDCGTCSENITQGSGPYGGPDNRFRDWMNSPEHRANILDGRYRAVGIGEYEGTFQGYEGTAMWTADFGARR